jgi:hypothetical protein
VRVKVRKRARRLLRRLRRLHVLATATAIDRAGNEGEQEARFRLLRPARKKTARVRRK